MNLIKAINFFVKKMDNYNFKDVVTCKLIDKGFSNQSFYLKTSDNKKFQVRFGMHNDIIFRSNEKNIIDLLKDLKDQHFFYDPSNGDSIRKWFEGKNPEPHEVDKNLIDLLVTEIKKIHDTDISNAKHIINQDFFVLLKNAENKIDPKHVKKYLELNDKYKDSLNLVLSHNDISLLNIIFNKEKNTLKIIDFEWGRKSDKYWDYGNFVRECNLNLDLIKYLAKKADLNLNRLLDYVYLATNFALQWAWSMPQTEGIIEYKNKVEKLLNHYYEKFFI